MIGDLAEFTRLMPKYFKTNNFKSFERQLHMYNFKKVKNAQKMPEFEHPLFRSGQLESILNIKRKINPAFSDLEVISKLKKPDFSLKNECQSLRRRNESLRELMIQMKNQNEKWSSLNQQIFCKLSFLKGISVMKSMKLLFLIFSLANEFSPKLLFEIRKAMMEFGGCIIDDNMDIIDVFVRLRKVGTSLRQQLTDQSYWTSRLLDEMIDVTCKSLTSKEELEADNHLSRLFKQIDNIFEPNHLTSLLIKPEMDFSKINEIIDRKIEAMKKKTLENELPSLTRPNIAQESLLNSLSWLYPSDEEISSDI